MNMEIDLDVAAVLKFMQNNVPASKLLAVADGVSNLARLLWGHHNQDQIELLRLKADPISDCDPHKQSAATEQRLAA
jgi:hypothetical protein